MWISTTFELVRTLIDGSCSTCFRTRLSWTASLSIEVALVVVFTRSSSCGHFQPVPAQVSKYGSVRLRVSSANIEKHRSLRLRVSVANGEKDSAGVTGVRTAAVKEAGNTGSARTCQVIRACH